MPLAAIERGGLTQQILESRPYDVDLCGNVRPPDADAQSLRNDLREVGVLKGRLMSLQIGLGKKSEDRYLPAT